MATERAEFVALGTIQTGAPQPALLASLDAIRQQCDVRFVELDAVASSYNELHRYRVDVKTENEIDRDIDLWLRIKSALMSSFPADKPNAVTAIDP